MRKFRAFSLAETLVALGLVGILSVTMLTLNNMSDNKYKTATTKLSKADSAMKTWGKAISKSNETGLGAAQEINSEAALLNSLQDYFNAPDNKVATNSETVTAANGEDYTGFQQIKLNDGTIINAKYVASGAGSTTQINGASYSMDLQNSTLAVITVSVPVDNSEETLSEEYALKSDGIQSTASLYEGWTKYEYKEDVTTPGGTTPSGGGTTPGGSSTPLKKYCTADGTDCIISDNDSKFVYGKTTGTYACETGHTGSIQTQSIGTPSGTFNVTVDTCCPSPKIANMSSGTKECSCVKTATTVDPGYKFDGTAYTCQTACQEGTYSSSDDCVLCDIGHYCPSSAMSAPEECPEGYACPNDKTKKISKDYNAKKYVLNAKKVVTDVKDGGLINSVICKEGTYQNEKGQTSCKVCPAGSYCPDKGMIDPIKCPAGTYNAKTGIKTIKGCLPCPKNKVCPNPGTVTPSDCDASKGFFSTGNATTCGTCPAGQYLKVDSKGTALNCSACKAGYYCPTAGLTEATMTPCTKGHYCPAGSIEPTACACGKYQDETGKTSCKNVAAGTYAVNSANEYATSAATGVVACEEGYACPGACNPRELCTAGYYASNASKAPVAIAAVQCTICQKGYKCPVEGTITHRYICNEGTYQPEEGKTECLICAANTFQDLKGQTSCKLCPSTSNTNGAEGSTSIAACQCPAGQYGTNLKGSNLTPSSICTNCPANTYKSGRANLKSTCLNCPSNSGTNKKTGVTVISECKCNAGYGTNSDGSDLDTAGTYSCQSLCAYYSPAYNNKLYYCGDALEKTTNAIFPEMTLSKFAPYPVKDMVYGPLNASTAAGCKYRTSQQKFTDSNKQNHCAVKACPANSVPNPEPDNTTHQRRFTGCLCNPGYYMNATGTACTPCPKGTYSNVKGATSANVCQKCPAGTYGKAAAATTSDTCTICPCGHYQDKEGQPSCKKTIAGTYWPNAAGKNTPEYGLTSPNGTACSGDAHASATAYCPTGSCEQKSCPQYGAIYMITDGHGYNKTLNELLNTFTCISKSGFSSSELNISGGSKIFIINRVGDKFNLIDSGTLQTNINTLRTSSSFNKVFGNYTYSASGVTYGNTCGSAHSSSSSGGTLRLTTNQGVQCNYTVLLLGKRVSPLILDLDGDGKNLTPLEDGVKFDLDANGEVEQSAWTGIQYKFDDAFLCLDRNENGLIDDGKELFGDQHGSSNGFDELAKFDMNNDGVVNEEDEIYNKLLLWVDFNKNGTVDYITEADYELLSKQIQRYNRVDLKENMECKDNICTYYVFEEEEICEEKEFLFIDYMSCHTNKTKRAVNPATPENGKTIEFKKLADYNIDSLSISFEEVADDHGNLLLDHHGNTVGMEGSFTQRVQVGLDEAFDELGNLIEGIVEVAGNFFKSITKSMTDVWFVTDND